MYAEDNGILFMETSSETSMNVNNIFTAVAKKLVRRHTSDMQSVMINAICMCVCTCPRSVQCIESCSSGCEAGQATPTLDNPFWSA